MLRSQWYQTFSLKLLQFILSYCHLNVRVFPVVVQNLQNLPTLEMAKLALLEEEGEPSF